MVTVEEKIARRDAEAGRPDNKSNGLIHHEMPSGTPLVIDEATILTSVCLGGTAVTNGVGAPDRARILDVIGPGVLERIQEASRLVSIGELTDSMAHEINNLLTIVAGFAELMTDCTLPQPFKDYVQRIYLESHRAAEIVQSLLAFSRKRDFKKEFQSIQDILKRALEMKQYEFRLRNIHVDAHWPRNLPRTIVDEGQLTQAILSILTNAEQAITDTHGAGRVTLDARRVGGYLQISITDNGPGIPKENLQRIFDPFFTTKGIGQGTGLGLSECSRIVRQHHGRLWAESHLGRGTTFHLELPILGAESDSVI